MKISKEIEHMISGEDLPLYEKAVVFAAAAHCGATRKGSRIPYLSHPIEAAAIVAEMTDDEELIAAAVLHDVIEDTDVTKEEIERCFGLRVAHYVGCETEDKRRDLPPGDTWKLRKQEAIAFMRDKADTGARMLALGDKLSNLRAIERDYQNLGDRLWERFNQKDKHMHGWLYKEAADALRELSEYSVWQEYARLVKKVFEVDFE